MMKEVPLSIHEISKSASEQFFGLALKSWIYTHTNWLSGITASISMNEIQLLRNKQGMPYLLPLVSSLKIVKFLDLKA